MKELIEKYKEYRKKIKAYGYAFGLIGWDSSTVAPVNCFKYRGEQIGVLAEEYLKIEKSREYKKIVNTLYKNRDKLNKELCKEITDVHKSLTKIDKVPTKEMVEYSILTNNAMAAWEKAKNESNYEIFRPYLEKIIEFKKKYVKYCETKTLKGYDVLLDEYEEGMTQKEYDEFFNLLKKDLVPFVKKIAKTKLEYNRSFLKKRFETEKQKKFMLYLQKVMCYDTDSGYMAESEHPFTNAFGICDVRITTHYYEDNVSSSIFSVIHELGHAKYMQDVDKKFEGTFMDDGASMAMHESQSRFFENIVGRSKPFWDKHFKELKKEYKDELDGITVNDFVKHINEVELSYIRTEADELTYPLHIMLRYDIEKMIFEGKVTAKDLPKVWNEIFYEYFGLKVKNDKEGILQDMHWSDGSFGYFPTYALGSAYGAQFLHAMRKDLDFDKACKEDTVQSILNWLKDKIHKYGGSKYPKEIIKKATGQDFNAKYYVEYLIDKYSKLYGVK